MKQHRNTRQKQMILDMSKAHHDHPSADRIYMEIRAVDKRISRGTVYRNLNRMVEAGELCRVRVPSADRFDSRPDRHYHLFCTECGAVCDAPLPYRAESDRAVAAETGFLIERHRTVYEGLCPDCRKNGRQSGDGTAI